MKCFEFNKKNNKSCQNKTCRYWVNCKNFKNCSIVMLKDDGYDESKMTLQDVGDIFKVTRMRICQIEKNAIKKLKDKIKSTVD